MLTFPALIVCASLSVVDGDTIKCDGQNMRLLGGGIVDVRGIDTPELRTWKCEKERKLAKLARNRLKELLAGKKPRIIAEGEDKFGRPLINIYVDGREVGKRLLDEGFAREWIRRQKTDWCR